MTHSPTTAFVLGGGGVLGASEVGMARALVELGVVPDLVLGTSVGALNGAALAREPSTDTIEALTRMWTDDATAVWEATPLDRVRSVARTGTALHSSEGLRAMLVETVGDLDIAELAVPFGCCASSIERASEHWFESGPLVPAVLASCAVPGLFPAVRVGDEHFLDGGLVNSIPVSRAVERGATTIYVLQVGRVERALVPPTRPWEVATVAFEIARRHRFSRDLATIPEGITVRVMPSGDARTPLTNLRYRDTSAVRRRIQAAYEASAAYLADLAEEPEVVAGDGI